jgi:hypothetical protein
MSALLADTETQFAAPLMPFVQSDLLIYLM